MAIRSMSPWIPVVFWAALIFGLSSIPGLGTDLGVWDLVLRKIGHAVEFAVLGALVYRALRHAPAAIAVASAYAATDEVHQIFVSGRRGSPIDWAIDTAGAVVGVALMAQATGKRRPDTADLSRQPVGKAKDAAAPKPRLADRDAMPR